MSSVLSQGGCPKCGSSDAFTLYSDGHGFCFSCRKYKPATNININHVKDALSKRVERLSNALPSDSITELPKEPYLWIKQYGLTPEEISNNGIQWSSRNEMLIFPMYGESKDEILMWCGRYFPSRSPKVYTSGFPDNHILFPHRSQPTLGECVVVVEDVVSAIKVTRLLPTTPLFGAHLSLRKAVRLSKMFAHLVLWLDQDKTKDMLKFKEKYSTLFESIKIVSTKLDPKEYSTEQIKEFLYE